MVEPDASRLVVGIRHIDIVIEYNYEATEMCASMAENSNPRSLLQRVPIWLIDRNNRQQTLGESRRVAQERE